MNRTSQEVYDAVVAKLTDTVANGGAELRAAESVFPSDQIPDGVKDQSFQLVPGGVTPEGASGGSIDVEVTFDLTVIFLVGGKTEREVLRDTILPIFDRIVRVLVPMFEFARFDGGSVGPDEESRYLVLTMAPVFTFCMAV